MNHCDKAPLERPAAILRSRVTAKAFASACVLALAVTACSSSSSSSSGATTAGTASPGGQYAQHQVAAAMRDPAAPVPTAPISNVASLRGKTIYYVPISSDIPAFAITAAAMKTALASAGVKLDVCSGNFNPSQFTACFSQAIGAHAAAIVSDGVPFQVTQSLIREASAGGIAVVVTETNPVGPRPQAKNIAYIPDSSGQYRLPQDWIIADSGGKADVLELEATDTPTSTAATAQYAVPELKAHCPGCKTTLLKFSSSNEQDLPSLVSAALLKDPGINYIFPEYDQYVSFVTQGVQNATATTRVKMAASASALSGLQDVATSTSTVKAEVAENEVYSGWVDADEAMRTAAGQAAVPYTIPIRLFTAANVGGVQLTDAGAASGSWFGSTGYQQQFEKLWGA